MPATDEQVTALAEAYQRHGSKADWYGALLANAFTQTDDFMEAIEIADAAIEEMPEPPETTDEEEAAEMKELGAGMEGMGGEGEGDK